MDEDEAGLGTHRCFEQPILVKASAKHFVVALVVKVAAQGWVIIGVAAVEGLVNRCQPNWVHLKWVVCMVEDEELQNGPHLLLGGLQE